jgi:hypothetical protein
VHKGGYVNWYHRRYFHDDLKQLAGLWVYATIDDWLAITLEIYTVDAFQGPTIIAQMESDTDYRLRRGIVT